MGYDVKKTEHSGSKKGSSFYGRRHVAKLMSKVARRMQAKKLIREQMRSLESQNWRALGFIE